MRPSQPIAKPSQVRSQTDRKCDRKTVAIPSQTDRSNRYRYTNSNRYSRDLPYGDQLPTGAGHVDYLLTSTVQVSNSTQVSHRARARGRFGKGEAG